MNKAQQIIQAAILGTKAYNNGITRAPCQDARLLDMLKNRPMGITPTGEASTVEIFTTWSNAWDLANLSAKVV